MDTQDKIFFRNFSVTVAILAVMMLLFFITARAVTDMSIPDNINADAIDQRTKPIGELVTELEHSESDAIPAATEIADPIAAATTAEAASTEVDGAGVYSGLCISCHGSGIPGIPQTGNSEEWAERLAKGTEALYANAINGYIGASGIPMPAKGGNPALSDAEVQAAVDYMLENSK